MQDQSQIVLIFLFTSKKKKKMKIGFQNSIERLNYCVIYWTSKLLGKIPDKGGNQDCLQFF